MLTESLLKTGALCVSLVGPHYLDLRSQLEKAVNEADLVELRLDKMTEIDLDELRHLRRHFSIPMIFTLRKASQGGDFQGSEQERLANLVSLTSLEPEYMDLEADIPLSEIRFLQNLAPSTKWIISWHDFNQTPSDLETLFQNISQLPSTFYKIATKAKSTCDALRLLSLAQKVNADKSVLCVVGMEEEGQSTRILAPVVGCPFTFASLSNQEQSAPGQLTLDELTRLYSYHSLNRETQILGLIGDPVSGSLSHLSHNAVLKELKINGVYVKFKVRPEELSKFLHYASLLPFKGLSVTMPHKETILNHLSSLNPQLGLIGACNTLLFEQGETKGCNTDGIGAIKAMQIPDLTGKKILIIGAGGTAKAIAHEVKKQKANVTIVNRTAHKAKDLAQSLNCQWKSLEDFSLVVQEGYDILIQTTPIGMAPHLDVMPITEQEVLPKTLVFDVIWNPIQTQLLQVATSKGCQTCNGLELFIQQAILQFTFWFGTEIDQTSVEQTIRHEIDHSFITKTGILVQKSSLQGQLALPSSKSHSIRAILLGAMTQGTSIITSPLRSPDVEKAIEAARQLGAIIQDYQTFVKVQGVGGDPQAPDNILDAGNSGQVLRFAGALAALSSHYTVITGDSSIRSNRPVQPLLDGLSGLGVMAESTRQNGYAPIIIKGPIKPGCTSLSGEDSQPVSALLMAAAFVDGKTEILVRRPGETPWIDLTLAWLDRLEIPYTHQNYERFVVNGRKKHFGFNVTIPGDFSSAAFPLVAALITQSEIKIENVEMDDVQGDKKIIPLLQQMGALIEIQKEQNCLIVKSSQLKGCKIDINPMIDAITILAVVGCFAEGETVLFNGHVARHKECDRISSIASELRKMGADIEEREDGLCIRQSRLQGACVQSYQDHRMALSLMVAGLGAEGETLIEGVDCIDKSYPNFIVDMQRLGAQLYYKELPL